MTAFRPFRMDKPLQQSVDDALVTGVKRPHDADRLGEFQEAPASVFFDESHALRTVQVAERTQGLLPVLEDLVVVDAHAGLVARQPGAGLRVLALVDGPSHRRDHLVHAASGSSRQPPLGPLGRERLGRVLYRSWRLPCASPQSGGHPHAVEPVPGGAPLERIPFTSEAIAPRAMNVFPHRALAQVGVAQPQGRQNPAVAFHGPPPASGSGLRTLAVPKRVSPHRDQLMVEAALVADQVVERIVESGVPAGDFAQTLSTHRIFGPPHGPSSL